MPHSTTPHWLRLLLCLLLLASWASAQVEIPYSLESFTTSNPAPSAKEVEQALRERDIKVDEVQILQGKTLISSSIDAHQQIFEQLNPAGNWVSGYLYFKVSRTEDNGTTTSIRYYTQLPHLPSGRRLSESLHFKLEPIYSAEDLQRIAPELPKQFDANISYTSNVEDSKIISLICEIQSKDLPNLSTEFSTLPNELLKLGGVSVKQNAQQVNAQWQCRLFANSHDPEREAFKQKIQPYLNAPRATSDRESQELEDFFERAGVDFKSHPKNNLIFDGEQLVLRLPPAEMAKARAIMAQYNEIRQSTVTASYSHETASAKTAIYTLVTCLSGKRAEIYTPNLSLFGYIATNANHPARIEFSSTTNLNNDDITALIFESRGTNILGQSSLDTSQEISLPADKEIQVLRHQIKTTAASDLWTFSVSNRRHIWGKHEKNEIVTDFIPISRRAIVRLTGQTNPDAYAPVDPFAAPTHIKPIENEKDILKALQQTGLMNPENSLPQSDIDLAFDGEQLIITARYEIIEQLKQQILQLNYQAPAVGTLELHYENENGDAVSHQTSLASDSGKRATFTIRQDANDPTSYRLLSGTEMTLTPIIEETVDRLSFFADMEWRMKLTNQNQDWWITLDQNFGDARSAKQFLPPISEYSWDLKRMEVFED